MTKINIIDNSEKTIAGKLREAFMEEVDLGHSCFKGKTKSWRYIYIYELDLNGDVG